MRGQVRGTEGDGRSLLFQAAPQGQCASGTCSHRPEGRRGGVGGGGGSPDRITAPPPGCP